MYRYSEERPAYRLEKPSYIGQSAAQPLQAIASQTERAGIRRADMTGRMITDPLDRFEKSQQLAEEQRLARAQDERAQRLTDLQAEEASQRIAREKEFGSRRAEAEIGTLESGRTLAQQQAEDYRKYQEWLDSPASDGSGKTNREYLAEKAYREEKRQSEKDKRDAATAALQQDTLRLEARNLKLGITKAEREDRVRTLSARFASVSDPQERKRIADSLLETANADEIAMALGQVKDAEMQQRWQQYFFASMIPGSQRMVEMSLEAQNQTRQMNERMAELHTAMDEIKQAKFGTPEERYAAERAARVLQGMGYDQEAKELLDAWTWGRDKFDPLKGNLGFSGRGEKIQEIISKVNERFANNLEAQYGDIPSVQKTVKYYRDQAQPDAVKVLNRNIMDQGPTQRFAPLPDIYDPTKMFQQPQQQQQQQQPSIEMTNGRIQQTGYQAPPPGAGGQQGPFLTPQMLEVLKKGKLVNQSAGR